MSKFYTSHHYILNSKHKSDPTQKNNNVSIKGPNGFDRVAFFKIKKIDIPHTYYPFNSNNNILTIFKNGDTQDRSITIPPGNYTVSEMMSTLKTLLDALAGPVHTYTITEETNHNNRFIITQDSSTFIIRGSGSANDYLGFGSTDTSAAIAHTGDHSYNLSGTNHIKVYSRLLTDHSTLIKTGGNDDSDLLTYVPVTASYGEIIHYHPAVESVYDINPNNLDINIDIDIQLLNENGDLLGGTNGLNNRNFVIDIEFFTYRKNHPKLNQHTSFFHSENGAGDVYN